VSRHRQAFEQFAEEAKEELGDSLKQLYLYGSVARGDETEDSDIDVFAVVESEEDLDYLRDLAYEAGVLERGVFISVQGQTEERHRERENHPFIRTVTGEGEAYL
jgi:predicted nucleotidyltransferase